MDGEGGIDASPNDDTIVVVGKGIVTAESAVVGFAVLFNSRAASVGGIMVT